MEYLKSFIVSDTNTTNDSKNDDTEEEKKIDNSNIPDSLGVDIHSTDNDQLKISILPPSLQNGLKRLPMMICCVVDTSGSMGCDAIIKDENGKSESHGLSILDLVKHSIKTIIECLGKKDYLSIISYSNKAKIITNLIKMTKKNKKKTLKALESLQADGQTNLWDGLFQGLEQLRKCKEINTFNNNSTIMLFTDGLPNIIPPKGHIEMLNSYIKQYKQLNGCINTYGFGYSLDTQLLTQLAIKGNGYYSFIPDSTMVGTIFVHAISNFAANIAKNVIINVNINKDYDSEIIGGYDYINNENKLQINLGNIMYGQNKDIIIQCKSKQNNNNNNEDEGKNDANNISLFDIEKCSLNYISLRNNTNINNNLSKFIINTNKDKKNAETFFEMSYYRLISCDVLTECMKLMKLKEIKQSQNKLKQLIQIIENNKLINKEKFIIDLLKDLSGQCFEAISTEEAYNKWGKHYIPSIICAHLHSFCNNFKDPGVQYYGGKLFNTLRDKANDIFINMPAPKSSYKPPDWLKEFADENDIGSHRAAAPVAMSSYMNASGGCFDEYCYVQMNDNKMKYVKDLNIGDIVKNGFMVKCVVKYKCKNNKMMLTTLCGYNGLKITPYHPIRVNNEWVFPVDVWGGVTKEEIGCEYVYNFVLESGHVLNVNGIECCTLGHGFQENNVIKHEYFGTDRIVNDLRLWDVNQWKNGEIVLDYGCFKRDENSGLVCQLVQK